jgi:hypothetical protein
VLAFPIEDGAHNRDSIFGAQMYFSVFVVKCSPGRFWPCQNHSA